MLTEGTKTVILQGKRLKRPFHTQNKMLRIYTVKVLCFTGTVKPVKTGPLSKRPKILFFKTNYRLMQVKSVAGGINILQYFRPSLSQRFVLSIFEWLYYTGFTVFHLHYLY